MPLFFLSSMLPQYMALCVSQLVCFVKKIQATSKQGRRLRFGMLTALTNIRSTKVLHHASCIMHHASSIMHCRQEAEIWYVDCSHKYKMNQGVMVGGRRPLVEDNLKWKTTFVGRRLLVEDDPCMLPSPLCGIFL